jgi:hypothetical protein
MHRKIMEEHSNILAEVRATLDHVHWLLCEAEDLDCPKAKTAMSLIILMSKLASQVSYELDAQGVRIPTGSATVVRWSGAG